MSSSGQYAVACYTVGTTVNGYIYSSSDYGKTWTIYSNASQALTLPWSCVSISGTGQYAIAGTSNNFGRIYCSSDYGRTWTNNNTTLLKSWKCVSISASGKHAIAGNNSDQCYLSTNNSTTTITKDLTDVFDPLWKYNTWTASNSVVPTKSSITVLDQFWSSLKMSLNGNFAIGCIYNGFIYYSQDYGMTWAKSNAPSAFWTSVSMSATGQYAIACSQQSNNKIYYSSNYGVTWAVSNSTSSATSGTGWQCVSMSATGKYAVGSLWNGTVGTVYYSSDYGVNWTQSTTTETGKWISIAMSATGQIVFGCIDKQLGQVYFSSNYGASFSVRTDSPEGYWSDIAISASGQYVIGFNGGYWFIVYSTDYGQTWNGKAYSFNLIVNSLTMSATGQYALATSMSTPGYVYYSTDFGITWNNTNFPGVYVQSVAISGLGNAAIFSPTYGNIYYCSPNNL